ncbi:MAG: class I SAM-dependent methyltransferase [Thermoactinomyces sp.]
MDFGKTAGDYAKYRIPGSVVSSSESQQDRPHRTKHPGYRNGYLARPLAKQGAEVTGLDPSSELLAASEQLDQKQDITIHYVQGRAEKLPFPDQSFHIVTAGQCWHWFKRDQVSREVYRVLKPSGKIDIDHVSMQREPFEMKPVVFW